MFIIVQCLWVRALDVALAECLWLKVSHEVTVELSARAVDSYKGSFRVGGTCFRFHSGGYWWESAPHHRAASHQGS